MNLFLAALNLPGGTTRMALDTLRNMKTVYPSLDLTTFGHFQESDTVLAAWMHSADADIFPRVYIDQRDQQVTLWDGCLADGVGVSNVFDAATLASNWETLHEFLEGQYAAVQVRKNPASIEIINDSLGMYPVYYLRQDQTWLVSNSVELLSQIGDVNALDPLGVSMFLSYGWASGDRTLRQGIKVLPHAQRWKLVQGSNEPKSVCYFKRSDLAQKAQRALSQSDIEKLGEQLIQPLKNLAQSSGALECPITGGRDSRVMVALLMSEGIDAQFYTGGAVESNDAKISGQLARQFDLPYVFTGSSLKDSGVKDKDAITDNWDATSTQFVLQNDGMISLGHIRNSFYQPLRQDSRLIHLYGGGGEIARGFYDSAAYFLHTHDPEYVQRYLSERLTRNRTELLSEDALLQAQAYLKEFVAQVLDEGFAAVDVPDLFYTYERVRRWGGANFRPFRPKADVFSPFCTRPFIRAAFSVPAMRRYAEHVHYELIRSLTPALHRFPLEKKWKSQVPLMAVLNSIPIVMPAKRKLGLIRRAVLPGRSFRRNVNSLGLGIDQQNWLKSQRTHLRELCLDQAGSPIWDYVDRTRFEQITVSDAALVEGRRHQQALLDILTLFKYDAA